MAKAKKHKYSQDKYIVFTDVARILNRQLNEIPVLYGSLAVEFRVKRKNSGKDISIFVSDDLLKDKSNSLFKAMELARFKVKDRNNFVFVREDIEFAISPKSCFENNYNINADCFEFVKDYAEYYLPGVNDLKIMFSADNRKDQCLNAITEQLQINVINCVRAFIRNEYDSNYYGENYHKSIRVQKLACNIAKHEDGDEYITSLSALLIYAGENGMDYESLLYINGVDKVVLELIGNTIRGVINNRLKSTEAKCIHDALIIDKLGAVGIAGAFAHDARRDITMYNTEITPNCLKSERDYQNYTYNTISYFHNVLMNLKNDVVTTYGKQLADKRTNYMQEFLYEFYDEWEGIIQFSAVKATGFKDTKIFEKFSKKY